MTRYEAERNYYARLVAELRTIGTRQNKYAECEHAVVLREAEKKQAADDAVIVLAAARELERIAGVAK